MSDKENDTLISSAEKLALNIAGNRSELHVNTDQMIDAARKYITPFESFFEMYSCAIMEMETKFNVLNKQFSLIYDGNPIVYMVSRVKDIFSVLKKLDSKKLPHTVESIEKNIKDMAGVRVVCSFIEDIYRLEKCLLSQDDVTLIEKKDYIANPKPSGYRSLHLIVSIPIFLEHDKKDITVEVQLRTIAMDFWANLEHKLKYKKNIDQQKYNELSRELVDCAQTIASLDERMQNVRDCLPKDNVGQPQTIEELMQDIMHN